MDAHESYIILGSVPFIIDAEARQLKQFNKPDHIVPFDRLTKHEDYYTLTFDSNRKLIIDNESEISGNEHDMRTIIIPALILEPDRPLSQEMKDDLNLLSQKKEWGIYLSDKDTALRFSGMLPHIDLAGADFTVDWRLKQMRDTEEPWNNISFADMEMSDNGEEYLCFYNTETHEIFEPDEDLFEMPENIVVLEIPYELKLDPVAVAREYCIGEIDLLPEHPFQMKLTAKVTPLSETGLANFIAENIKARDSQQGTNNDLKSGRGR